MGIRTHPEDFRVDELFTVPARGNEGRFAYYKLSKRKMTTIQAVGRIARHLSVSPTDIRFIGLKDKQAVSSQLVSVDTPAKVPPLHRADLKLAYLGRGSRHVQSEDVKGNAFGITSRGLTHRETRAAEATLPSLKRAGLPNYFDDQRFGALEHGQGWVLLDVAKGNLEGALFALCARPSKRDRSTDAEAKADVARAWGDWGACARLARGSSAGTAMRAMSKTRGDFISGLKGIPLSVRLLHTHAFQSYIWNESVGLWLKHQFPGLNWLELRYLGGKLRMWRDLDNASRQTLANTRFPLIDVATPIEDAVMARCIDRVLSRLGLTRADLQVEGPAGFVLKYSERPVLLSPRKLTIEGPMPDRENRGRMAITARFHLPRGAYATLVLHRLLPSMRRIA